MVYIVNNKLKILDGMLLLDHCLQRNVDSQIKTMHDQCIEGWF